MFQFASTLAVGKRKGYEVKFPLENCNDLRRIGPIDLNTGALSDVKCDLLDCFENISDVAENGRDERYRIRLIQLLKENKNLIEELED
jgi:hypothetical protein